MAEQHLVGIGYRFIRGGELQFSRASQEIRKQAQGAGRDIDSAQGHAKRYGSALGGIVSPARAAAAALALVGAAAVASIPALAISRAAEFEKRLVGVGKTTDIQGQSLAQLGVRIDELSRRLPNASSELLGIAQAAGQLGVQGADNIVLFTETVAKLGGASDLAGEEAATALARILNVTGESVDRVDVLASTIVALGNSFAATESEIARHAGEVGRATAVYDLGSGVAAAFGATLAALGVRAELSGSAVARGFRAIEDAVKGGGERMQNLVALTGRSAEEIRAAFERGPLEAFQLFLGGVRDVVEGGGNVSQALKTIGLSGEEVLKVIPVLAKEQDLLAQALQTAAREQEDATALNQEAGRALDTLSGQAGILENQIASLVRVFGEGLAPETREIVEGLQDWVEGNRDVVRSLGELAGSGLSAAAKGAALLARNIDLVAAGATALVGIRLAAWLTSIAATTELAAIAQADLATALWATRSGYLKLAVGQIITKFGAWAAASRVLALATGPVAIALAAISGAAVYANRVFKDWARDSEGGIHRVVAAASQAGAEFERFRRIQASRSASHEELRELVNDLDFVTRTIETTKRELKELDEQLGPLRAPTTPLGQELRGELEALESRLNVLVNTIGAIDGITVSAEGMDAAMRKVFGPPGGGGLSDAAKGAQKEIAGLKKELELLGEGMPIDEVEQIVELLEAGVPEGEARSLAAQLKKLTAQKDGIGALNEEIAGLTREVELLGEGVPTRQVERLAELLEAGVPEEEALALVRALDAITARRDRLSELNELLESTNVLTGTTVSKAEFPGELDTSPSRAAVRLLQEEEEAERIREQRSGKLAAVQRRDQEQAAEAARRAWADSAVEIGQLLQDAFGGANQEIGQLIAGATAAVGAFSNLQSLSKSTGGSLFGFGADAKAGDRLQGALAGAQLGTAAFGIGQSLGLFQGNRGTGRLGGQLSGDFADTGATIGGAIGGAFGPVWGAVGAAAGAVLGGLIKRGADDARATIQQAGDDLQSGFRFAEGNLGDALDSVVDGIIGAVNDIEARIGAEIDTGGLDVKIRDDVVTIFVRGIRRAFEGDTAIEDAVTFAVSELLRTAQFGEGTGEATRTALSSGGFQTFEELDQVLQLAQAIDALEGASGPVAQAFLEINALRKREADLAKEHGLALSDVLRLGNERVRQLREEVDAQFEGIVGTQNAARAAIEFAESVRAFNEGLERERATREKALAGLQGQEQSLQHLVDLSPRVADGLNDIGEVFGPEGEMGRPIGSFLGRIQRAPADLEALQQEIADTIEALETLPEAIDEQRIAQAFSAAGAQQALGIIHLIRQVRGEQFAAGEEQRFQAQLFALQLVTSYQALLQLIEASEGLFTVSDAFLASVRRVIEQVTRPGFRLRDRGADAQAHAQAERDAQERDRLLQDLDDLAAQAFGTSDAILQLRRQFDSLDESLERARELGIAEERIAQARADQIAVLRQDQRERLSGVGDTSAEAAVADLVSRRKEEFEIGLELAAEQAALTGEDFATIFSRDFFPPIAEAFNTEAGLLADQLRANIESALGSVQGALDQAEGIGPFNRQLLDLDRTFDDVRDEVTDNAEALEDLSAIFGAAAGETLDLAQIMERLEDAEKSAAQGIAIDFIGSLAQLGVSLPTDQMLQLAQAQFQLAQAEAIATVGALEAAGALDGLGITAGELLELIANADFDLSVFNPNRRPSVPPPPRSGSGSAQQAADDLDRVREAIERWSGTGDAARELREMAAEFEELQKIAQRDPQLLGQLTGAFEGAVEDFWREALGEDAQDTVQSALDAIAQRFDSLAAAAADGLGDLERVEEARLRAIQDFWDEALAPVDEALRDLRGGELGGVSARQALQASEDELFGDLAQRALAGDLEAIQAIPAAGREFLEKLADFSGGGTAAFAAGEERFEKLLLAIKDLKGASLPSDAPNDSAPNQPLPPNVIQFPPELTQQAAVNNERLRDLTAEMKTLNSRLSRLESLLEEQARGA